MDEGVKVGEGVKVEVGEGVRKEVREVVEWVTEEGDEVRVREGGGG